MKKRAILFWLLVFTATPGFSQKRSFQVGLKLTNEFTFFDGLAPGIGGQVVYRITKHSGIESGLFYQSRRINYVIELQSSSGFYTYNTEVAEHRLQLPILYRFDSKILNFVFGPSIDYFIGWKERSNNPDVKITSYSRDPVSLTVSAGISKSIALSPTLILEPEAKFNVIVTDDDGGLSLNISLRKILN